MLEEIYRTEDFIKEFQLYELLSDEKWVKNTKETFMHVCIYEKEENHFVLS